MEHIEFIQSQIALFFEIPTLLWDGDEKKLVQFEQEHCLFPNFQEFLERSFFKALIQDGAPNILYHTKDSLEIESAILNLDSTWLFIGPFVSAGWNDKHTEILLAGLGFPQSHFVSYKLYRCSYQIVNIEALQKMVNATCGTLNKKKMFFPIYPITTDYSREQLKNPEQIKQVPVDYSIIQRRYQVENKFIEMIQLGNTEEALAYWEKMKQMSDGLASVLRGHTGVLVGTAIIRTLVRQAVKSTGIHFATLHAITQKYSQRVQNDSSLNAYGKWSREFIIDICRAVRESSDGNYTLLIRQAIGYININLGEAISIDDIADEVGLSVSQLSKRFKAETGENISNYMTNKRTEKACRLLRFSDLPIQDISGYVGYIDNNYFVKVFKKNHQMTPSEYRRKYQTIS